MEHCLISFMVCKQVNRLPSGSQQHLGFGNLRRGWGGGKKKAGGSTYCPDVIGPQLTCFLILRAHLPRRVPLHLQTPIGNVMTTFLTNPPPQQQGNHNGGQKGGVGWERWGCFHDVLSGDTKVGSVRR